MYKLFSFALLFPVVAVAAEPAPLSVPLQTVEAVSGDVDAVNERVQETRRILVMDLRKGSGIEDEVVGTITSMLAVNVAQGNKSLDVLTGADVRQILRLEADKQTLGCTEEDNCLAELANAMGVELVLHGDVGRLGDLYIINLHVFDAREARSVARETLQVSVLDEFASKLNVKVGPMLGRALGQEPGEAAIAEADAVDAGAAPSPDDANYTPWILTGTGALLALAGGVVTAVGLAPWIALSSDRGALDQYSSGDGSLSQSDLEEIATRGAAAEESRQSWNTWGNKLFPVGIGVAGMGLGILAGGVLWAMQSAPAE